MLLLVLLLVLVLVLVQADMASRLVCLPCLVEFDRTPQADCCSCRAVSDPVLWGLGGIFLVPLGSKPLVLRADSCRTLGLGRACRSAAAADREDVGAIALAAVAASASWISLSSSVLPEATAGTAQEIEASSWESVASQNT